MNKILKYLLIYRGKKILIFYLDLVHKMRDQYFNNLSQYQELDLVQPGLFCLPYLPQSQDAVWSEDVDRIKSIKGIGLKTAQRLIIELKDKVELFDKKDIDLTEENLDIKKEALLALSVLGFNKSKAENIVGKVYYENKDIKLQELIKKSLNKL